MAVLFSVLIPTIPGRERELHSLLASLEGQAAAVGDVEVLVFRDNSKRTIGAKRNALLDASNGEYVSFVDDDDEVSVDYVATIREQLEKAPDVLCFEVFVNGRGVAGSSDCMTRFSQQYKYRNHFLGYERKPNHVMVWKRSIAIRFPFDDISDGEDDLRAERMCAASSYKELQIPKCLYTYRLKGDCMSAEVVDNQAPKITFAAIVKNASATLPRLIHQAKLAGCHRAVIGVDTTSTDCSDYAAINLGAEVIPITWNDDFAAARNAVLEHVEKTTEDEHKRGKGWILWLDKDEELTPEAIAGIPKYTVDPDHNAVSFLPPLSGGRSDGLVLWFRLFRLGQGIYWSFPIHETIAPSLGETQSKYKQSNLRIHHHGHHSPEKVAYYCKLLQKRIDTNKDDAEAAGYLAFEYALLNEASKAEEILEASKHLIARDSRLIAVKRWLALPANERTPVTDAHYLDAASEAAANGGLRVSYTPNRSAPLKLNLGSTDVFIEGFHNVDIVDVPGIIKADLNESWPWKESTVEAVVAHDVIEHLRNSIHTMNELWRVLKPGALAHIVVPTTDGPGAFMDPTHVTFWHRRSFLYFEDRNIYRERFAKSYGISARFEVMGDSIEETIDGPKLTIVLKAVK